MAKSFSRPRVLPKRGGLRLSDQQRKAATIWYNWYAGGGGSVYEPEYQAALNAGFGTPPATDAGKLAESNKIKTAKALGLWDAAARFYIMDSVSDDPDWKSINYKDVGNTSTYILRINSPTTAAKQGWTGNGTTAYLDFQFIPDGDGLYAKDNCSIISFCGTDQAVDGAVLFGAGDLLETRRVFLNPQRQSDGNCTYVVNDGDSSTFGVGGSNGLYIIRRISNTQSRISKDGGAEQVDNIASDNVPEFSMYGLGRNRGGSLASPDPRRIDEFILASGNIVPADVNTWYNNWIIERDAV